MALPAINCTMHNSGEDGDSDFVFAKVVQWQKDKRFVSNYIFYVFILEMNLEHTFVIEMATLARDVSHTFLSLSAIF